MCDVTVEESKKTVQEWAEIYQTMTGNYLNVNQLRKRRAIAGVGKKLPPSKYILTQDEFYRVLETPLPMCRASNIVIVRVDLDA